MPSRCKKKAFDSPKEAQQRLKEILSESPSASNLRVYNCPYCEKYHFTSMPIEIRHNRMQSCKKRTEKFVRVEAQHWCKKFKIDYD